MKNIITLLLALLLLLGACALADDRADMLVAAAVNEGLFRDKGRLQQIRRVGRQRLRRMVLGVRFLVREFRRRILRHIHARQRLSLADQLRGRLDVV